MPTRRLRLPSVYPLVSKAPDISGAFVFRADSSVVRAVPVRKDPDQDTEGGRGVLLAKQWNASTGAGSPDR